MAGKKKTENLPLFLTPEQASKVSGIGVNRVRQLMDEGQLEYLPVGKPAANNGQSPTGLL